MLCVYVGDSKDVINRIRTNHCNGNVEGSALRRAVAEAMGYRLSRTKRPSGSIRIRIDLPDPAQGESRVSDYIRAGQWKYVICSSADEAKGFQWYAIAALKPVLNKEGRPWRHEQLNRYQELAQLLEAALLLSHSQIGSRQSGPGVYVQYHERLPQHAN